MNYELYSSIILIINPTIYKARKGDEMKEEEEVEKEGRG